MKRRPHNTKAARHDFCRLERGFCDALSGLFLLLFLRRLQWNLTAALPLAGILAGTTIIATLATALALTLVHALTIMLGNRRAATFALARILAAATILSAGAAA